MALGGVSRSRVIARRPRRAAVPNIWYYNVQGAASFGAYASGTRVVGPSCAADRTGNYCLGKNVIVDF